MGINKKGLNLFDDEIRNKNIWKEISPNKWKKKYPKILINLKNSRSNNKLNYIINNQINDNKKNQYIIFGKGL